jgi:pyruvate,orthophosphate dikinase
MAATGSRRVFLVDSQNAAGPSGSARSMGFKAYNLGRMAGIGLLVPQAIVLSTGYCGTGAANDPAGEEDWRALLTTHLRWMEEATGLTYGGSRKPLLLSVRSGAPVSMPGMMDTILNVGLNRVTQRGLLRMTGNPRLVWDSYRRFIESFGATVHGIGAHAFAAAANHAMQRAGVDRQRDLDARSLQGLCEAYLDVFRGHTGREFPQDPLTQLEESVKAVFRSWHGAKAADYRRLHDIDDAVGTAVTIQRMVFGNGGGASGSGVAFTRDPATGEKRLYMEFLFNAQGEDVVSGRHALQGPEQLSLLLPAVHGQVSDVARRLEAEFKDLQEFEFTVQDGTLFLLQTRVGKRTSLAALRIAIEQVREGLITPAEALKRIDGIELDKIEQVRLVPGPDTPLLCRAVPASVGVAVGALALDAAAARKFSGSGRGVVLVRQETTTEDIVGIAAADGLLTALGGRTSHAAVVARQLNKVCLVGCPDLAIDLHARACTIGGVRLREGDMLCLDASTGSVFAGEPQRVVEKPVALLNEISGWREKSGLRTAVS